MDLSGWDTRYRSQVVDEAPTPLVVRIAGDLAPGKALDLACGVGRNALWLARHDWQVTAVDGSPAAIGILRDAAAAQSLAVDMRIADLERHEFHIAPESWDLVVIGYYLQRDLIAPAKQGVAPGGILLSIVHITEPGEEPTPTRASPGELQSYFQDWQILDSYEGKPEDSAHRRAVAEIVARRPTDVHPLDRTGLK